MRYLTILGLATGLLAVGGALGSANAAGCPPIEAAAIKQATTPHHMIMDRVEEGGRHSEMIQTATTVYTLVKGKWVAMPYDAQERVKNMKESAEEQKIICQNVGHDDVDGQQTDHYTAQSKTDAGSFSGEVWISISTGLIVKQHMVHAEGGKKTTTEIRYDYANVIAPEESTPLKR
jgi:hypothetical protein